MEWKVEHVVLTRRGEVPLSELTPEEQQRLAEKIVLALARVLAPEGVQVRVRVRPRSAGGTQVEPVAGRPDAG